MKKLEINYYPFFSIKSEALKVMLGVKDLRSIRLRLNEIGITIHRRGRNEYIITEEIIQALDEEEAGCTSYYSKNPANAIFH